MWQHWINGVLGLWLIVSSFLEFSASAMSTNIIVVGIVVAVLAFFGASMDSSTVMREHNVQRT
ncbi:MAG: hypothetical protein A3G59_00510 [Candidatus Taylorbacteria bacterium RIFCSPLOWO2_12_FULL_47_20]|uniref:SPW repeat-containing integral membrane domain-containing protein n=2 Tax=Candidatus Tayloriibacteriota TaxID=1817919 RepID=A0A1G2P4G2_9BACT|nr:MAG: hypothetical protein A3H68_01905 [Candidatus Taylorbacteria bacterium RIFCSPLOWO2_02_FULL_46_40]OHA43224.1 MAG: hypothetical protein A3G59_00510 [Candidatus Taylorbacteria bacterium RIFCSPLOWO2_12_FULL_47_20]